MRQITEEQLSEVTEFVRSEIKNLVEKLSFSNNESIQISMPNWLIQTFKYHFTKNVKTLNPDLTSDSRLDFLFGYVVQAHYKDEVIVFYKDYHLNPTVFKPKVFDISE